MGARRCNVTKYFLLLRRVFLAFSHTVLAGFLMYFISEDSATRSFIYAPILLHLREEIRCIRGSRVLQEGGKSKIADI